MKKIIRLTVLFNLVFSLSGFASHLKGGEITWDCLGSGQYIFYLKIYRDCNGIPFGSSPIIDSINAMPKPSDLALPAQL